MDIKQVLEKPLDGSYSVSVEVILFSQDQKQVCLVLENGGKKTKGLFSFFKPRAWENPGGGVHKGEIPIQGATREVVQETGFPENAFEIFPEILDYKQEGTLKKPHHKIVFRGKINCDINDSPFQINPARDTLGRIFVPISELPNNRTGKYWKRRFGNEEYGIFASHLEHILANQRPSAVLS